MKRLVSVAIFITCLLAVSSVASAQAQTMRNWSSTWVGRATIVGNCQDGTLSFVESGAGFSEQTGMSQWSDKYCMNPTTWTATGRSAVITTENGDKIFMKIELLFIWNAARSGGKWIEHETIFGGTGKFAVATGSSHSSGTFMLTSQTTAEWDGVSIGLITY